MSKRYAPRLTADEYDALDAWQHHLARDARYEARALIEGPTPKWAGRGYALYCAGPGQPVVRVTSMEQWDALTRESPASASLRGGPTR